MSRRKLILATLLVVLAGCATPSKHGGIDAVDALVATQLRPGIESATGERDAVALAARVDALLAQPLTLERAVSVALLNNPRLLAEYAQLGVSRGDLIDASRLPNPRFGWRREDEGDSHVYTQSLSQEFAAALLLPARKRISQAEYARVQQSIAAAVIDLAADVEVAWFEALAAEQVAAMRAVVAKAAGLVAAIAGRFHEAGNLARLDVAHFFDRPRRGCVIEAGTPVGRDLNRLFIGFVNREFGADAFTVEHRETIAEAEKGGASE